jgi:hypothetical protein
MQAVKNRKHFAQALLPELNQRSIAECGRRFFYFGMSGRVGILVLLKHCCIITKKFYFVGIVFRHPPIKLSGQSGNMPAALFSLAQDFTALRDCIFTCD